MNNAQCYKEKYDYPLINDKILEFSKIIFNEKNFDGNVPIGYRDHNSDCVKLLCQQKVSNLEDFFTTFLVSDKKNYFITRNTFQNTINGASRKKSLIFSFNNIVIDIDCHNSYSKEKYFIDLNKFDDIIKTLNEYISVNELVKPNIIVKTGRGLQLWFHFFPIAHALSFKENMATDIIISQLNAIMDDNPSLFTDFNIDNGASKNQAGYYRLPMTYNTKTKSLVDFIILTPDTYNIDSIIDSYIVEKYNSKKITMSTLNTDNIITFKNKNSKSMSRCNKMIDIIQELRNTRPIVNFGNEIHENRTCYCFGLMSFAVNCMPDEKALEYVFQFNSKFKCPLPKIKIEYLHTFCTKRAIDSKTNKKLSFWTNKFFIDFFQLNESEQKKYNVIYTPDFVYDPINCNQQIIREQKRHRKEMINEKILEELNSTKKTYKEIAERFGVSISKIRDMSKKNSCRPKTLKPWIEQNISRSTWYRKR